MFVQMTAFLLMIFLLGVYLFQAASSRRVVDYSDPEAFFLSKGQHSGEEYGVSQTAYFLQMATIYPFFVWAYFDQWWLAVWNVVFFAAGIALFSGFLGNRNDAFLSIARKSPTLHAVIAKTHKIPRLRSVSSGFTIIAFIGLAMFELTWGALVIKGIFPEYIFLYRVSIVLLGAYLIIFLYAGGQRAALKSDKVQLLVALFGLHLMVGWMVLEHPDAIIESSASIFFGLLAIYLLVSILYRLLHAKQDGSWSMQLINIALTLSMCGVLYAIVSSFEISNPASYTAVLPAQIDWPTALGLFSLMILPVFFQFVDLSNWQRLSAVSGEDGNFQSRAMTGLKSFLVESPLSWLMPVALGLGAATFLDVGDGDAWQSFITHVMGLEGFFGAAVASLFCVAIIAVFLSTADALLCATGYAFAFDINQSTAATADSIDLEDAEITSEEMGKRREVVQSGRVFVSFAIGTTVVLYFALETMFVGVGDSLIGLFLAFFSPMLAFAPSLIVPMFTGMRAGSYWAASSIVLGSLTGLLAGLYSFLSPSDVAQWLPTTLTFIVSFGLYALGYFFARQAIDPE